MSRQGLVIAVLDTQVLLHFRPLDEIDWRQILQANSVTVVIAPIVLRELDHHKISHPQPRIRQRAVSILSKLDKLSDAGLKRPIRDGTVVRFLDRDPCLDFASHGLNKDVNDDWLLASFLEIQVESAGVPVLLVTDDSGLRVKAKTRGLPVMRLPDDLRLKDEPDPNERRIQELEREIRRLSSAVPQLRLGFADGGDHTAFRLQRPIPLTEAEVAKRLAGLKKRRPPLPSRAELKRTAGYPISLTLLTQEFLSPFHSVSDSEITRYNKELEEYYQRFAQYLPHLSDYENLNHRTIQLEVFLYNNGTAPADDIDIFLDFPDGFTLYDDEKFPAPPREPEPPQRPLSLAEQLGRSLHIPDMIRRHPLPDIGVSNVSRPVIRKTDGYRVEIAVTRLKQHLKEGLPTLFVVFDSFEASASFHIDYRINAANVTVENTGQLHVVVEKE